MAKSVNTQTTTRDPLGIGVPYYGETTSFDPVEYIRRRREERKADYEANKGERLATKQAVAEDFRKQIKPPEAWETEAYKTLSDEALAISQEYQQDVLKGGFNPMGSRETDIATKAKYDKKMNELQQDFSLYKLMKPKYDYAYQQANDVNKQELIDRELTKKNLDALYNAPDLKTKAEILSGDVIVFKPKPVEVMDELAKGLNAFVPDLDKTITAEDFDPKSGMWRTETLEQMDPGKLDKAMDQVWDSFSDRVQNEWKRRYEAAPAREKTAKIDGAEIPLTEKEWFKSKFSPQYAEKMGVSYRNMPKSEKKADTSMDWVSRNADGSLNVEDMTDVITINSARTATETPVKKVKRSGEVVYKGAETKEVSEPAAYNTISIPLTAFSDPFEMYIHGQAIDTETGKTPPLGKSAVHTPVRIDFMPTWTGDAKEVIIEDQKEDGTKVSKTYTLNPGDRIPQDIEDELQKEGMKFRYQPYLMTSSIYGASLQDVNITGDLSWSQYVSKNGKTMIVPWDKAKNEFINKMMSKKHDVSKLIKLINEMDTQLNSVESIFK